MLALFYALPLLSLVALSFLESESGHIQLAFTLKNYEDVFLTAAGRIDVVFKTLWVGLQVVVFSTIVSLPLAYYITRALRSPRAQTVLLVLFAAAFLVGPLVRTISWRGILGVSGLFNTTLKWLGVIEQPLLSLLYGKPAMILAMTYNAFPFMLFTLFLAMLMIDDRYIVAARDLGASGLTAFCRVVVPLSAPGLVTGAILVFVPTLSAVLEPELLGGPTSRLTPTAIRSQFFHTLNWPLGAALTVVFIVLGGLAIAAVGYVFARASREIGSLGLRHGGRQP
jgi:spermidine/putrescine transport system permease protein